MEWTRTDADIPTFDLAADPSYYVEKWGTGSWAAYRDDVRIGEPGSYGTLEEAQEAVVFEYLKTHPVDPASAKCSVHDRSLAACDHGPVEWAGRTFGQLTPAERARVTSEAANKLQTELQAAAPAIARVLDEAEQDGER